MRASILSPVLCHEGDRGPEHLAELIACWRGPDEGVDVELLACLEQGCVCMCVCVCVCVCAWTVEMSESEAMQ